MFEHEQIDLENIVERGINIEQIGFKMYDIRGTEIGMIFVICVATDALVSLTPEDL